MAEGGLFTKQAMHTMGNGMRAKFMALVDIRIARAIGFTKDFGREDNIVVRRLQNSPFPSNFFDNNMLLSFVSPLKPYSCQAWRNPA